MSEHFAEVFERARPRFEQSLDKTALAELGWKFADLAQYFYACIQRSARRTLEERGTLSAGGKTSKWRRMGFLGGRAGNRWRIESDRSPQIL